MKTSIRENKKRAREHFGITGKTNLVLHHKDPELRHKDRERYNEWRFEDLEVMTRSEHARLHNSLNPKERYEKVSNTLKGKKFTEEHKEILENGAKERHEKQ